MHAEFVIPGECVGKQRPKASFQQKRIYTPTATINYENFVKHCYYGNPHFGDKQIAIDLSIYLPIPTSASKKKQAQMESGDIKPNKRPDIDNCIKSILDGLNGVAYEDDKQIIEIHARKLYGICPRVEAKLWSI